MDLHDARQSVLIDFRLVRRRSWHTQTLHKLNLRLERTPNEKRAFLEYHYYSLHFTFTGLSFSLGAIT